MECHINVIDLKELLSLEDHNTNSKEFDRIGQSILDAFTKIGFAYIVNHGINDAKV